MATVADRSGNTPLDKSYCSFNRTNAGTPNAVLTPQYKGERVFDTTGKVAYVAIGLTNADWQAQTNVV
jgi:hypothetical protein